MPHETSEVQVDFDVEGLSNWARAHFGAELKPDELREKGLAGRRAVEEVLLKAAIERIDSANLDGLARFAQKDYGARELVRWADQKFDIKLEIEAVQKAAVDGLDKVEALIVGKVEELYRRKEKEFPAEFMMNTAMAMARQNPIAAFEQLCQWANERYQLGWTVDTLRQMGPQQARDQLRRASEKFVDGGELESRINEALAITDPAALEDWFKTSLNTQPPENLRRLKGQEREDAVRAKVESVLRAELLYFERTILIDTLDELWKNHLYAMDQLRDSIGYRAFSQQDPRIEYKREGSRMFTAMMEQVRERLTDYIFKVRIQPAPPPQAAPRPTAAPMVIPPVQTSGSSDDMYPAPKPATSPAPANGAPAAAPAAGAAIGPATMGTIAGPGFEGPLATLGTAATPMSDRAARDLEAAQRAGTPSASAAPKAVTVVKSDKRYGRNDACPMGSGRKYKKCCNRPDGTCNGSGMNTPAPAGDDN
ncbi:MAG: SEC-C metal-binding domain-containing protein [Phycisphaerales bacterium]